MQVMTKLQAANVTFKYLAAPEILQKSFMTTDECVRRPCRMPSCETSARSTKHGLPLSKLVQNIIRFALSLQCDLLTNAVTPSFLKRLFSVFLHIHRVNL